VLNIGLFSGVDYTHLPDKKVIHSSRIFIERTLVTTKNKTSITVWHLKTVKRVNKTIRNGQIVDYQHQTFATVCP